MKIVFMGTPDIALESLEKIYNSDIEVSGVVTVPDRPSGRSNKIVYSPVKEFALKNNIRLFQPEKISSNKEFKDEIRAIDPDLVVVVSYGMILPKSFLDIPKYGCINVHASLLPKYRGGAPIHRAIINGEEETGITIMYMDKGMDTGNIISMKSIPIENDDNLETLSNKLSILGRDLLLDTLPSIIDGSNDSIVQDEEKVVYAYNIKPEEEEIDFNNRSIDIYNLIRGLSPAIGAYFMMDDERLKVYKSRIGNNKYDKCGVIKNIYKDGIGISTKDGEIILEEIQPFGKKKMRVSDYLNGIDKNKLINKEL
jgi:methionyl-tRNA formyltransferase